MIFWVTLCEWIYFAQFPYLEGNAPRTSPPLLPHSHYWTKAVLLFSLRSWVLVWPWELNPWPPMLQSNALPTDLILLEDLCWFVANNAWIEKMLSNKAGDLHNFLARLSKEASAIVTRSLTFLMCGSKNYPYMYLPPRRDFLSDPPPPTFLEIQSSFIHLFKFLGLRKPPTPPGVSNPFCGGSMNNFWDYTISLCITTMECILV